jgi:hypothetical protein
MDHYASMPGLFALNHHYSRLVAIEDIRVGRLFDPSSIRMLLAQHDNEIGVLTSVIGLPRCRSRQSLGGLTRWTGADVFTTITLFNTDSLDSGIRFSDTVHLRRDASKDINTLLNDAPVQLVRSQISDETPWITSSIPRVLLCDPRRHDGLGRRSTRGRVR